MCSKGEAGLVPGFSAAASKSFRGDGQILAWEGTAHYVREHS